MEALWTEKYRPKTIDTCILTSGLKQTFQEYVTKGEIPHLLLQGDSGVGKTTVARALVNELGVDHLFINASNERNIDTLRDKIQGFATTISISDPGKAKIVILDEADYLNPNSFQPALRAFMEQYSDNCRFILTCNYMNKIIPPLVSRCTTIPFWVWNDDKLQLSREFAMRLATILKLEKVGFNPKDVFNLVTEYAPEWRRILNEAQKQARTTGKVVYCRDETEISVDYLIECIVKKNFTEARGFLTRNSMVETPILFKEIYRQLFNAARLDKACLPDIIICMNEYQYKEAFVADKELNRAAAVAELMSVCVWK